ncbi:DUF808 domain-containing protein [Chelatococcus sambhunathii]|uniref:DUF808 domain-containing protein n=1 Tax=Chelatococcus sambhunathii TaxID=363953 RepID=A0ABU1DAA2_9HYPH|nr:DUF808 domain-containing protein [Chelatococcus sambhunathii]MDR4305040.1 DUF808 domain-containing protein [Chelatococcus sambhunathii]
MAVGLVALLDDIASIAKVAASSLDDVASQTARAGTKAAGVVIDDTAVSPRYVVGFSPDRELPIVGKIALGSLRNKLLILLPACLLLSAFAPWAISPILMIGGAYLCYEGVEKIIEAVFHRPKRPKASDREANAAGLEEKKVAGAIKTDFILSAEIMAITLASITEGDVWTKALVLAVVGSGITAMVYGVVALIVKADDIGLAMARTERTAALGNARRQIGRAIVAGMPGLLKLLGIVGTAAMIWVGGGIIVHGLEADLWPWLGHTIEGAASSAAQTVPFAQSATRWIVAAMGAGLVGLAVGYVLVLATAWAFAPIARMFRSGGSASPGGEPPA